MEHLRTPSLYQMKLAVLEHLRLVVKDCYPAIVQITYCSLVIDVPANASDIFVGVLLSGLFWLLAPVPQHYHIECWSPVPRFSSARLAHHRNYRILHMLVAKRYSK